MKKNKMMRLASGLLVATLLTTSVISGTFAKYVTSTEANDTARVAKWGVQLSTDTNLFDEKYATDDTNKTFRFTGEYSAEAATMAGKQDDIMAPGTTGKMNFSIIGTPEVAVNVKVDFDKDNGLQMITLKAKNTSYVDYTVVPNATFKNLSDYNPVQYTLKRANTEAALSYAQAVCTGNLEAIQDYFKNTANGNFEPNTKLDDKFGYYELSWEWSYEGNDQADTYLGNVAAGLVTDTNALITEAFKLDITVTQID